MSSLRCKPMNRREGTLIRCRLEMREEEDPRVAASLRCGVAAGGRESFVRVRTRSFLLTAVSEFSARWGQGKVGSDMSRLLSHSENKFSASTKLSGRGNQQQCDCRISFLFPNRQRPNGQPSLSAVGWDVARAVRTPCQSPRPLSQLWPQIDLHWRLLR